MNFPNEFNKRKQYSAGILPYARHKDKIYFLLGKDYKDDAWSDFGGKAELFDNCLTHKTAAREFYEETVGSIFSYPSVENLLKKPENYKLIRSTTLNGSPYYMYVIQIPYDNYRKIFIKTLDFIKHVKLDTGKYYEKSDTKWISKESLLVSINKNLINENNRNQYIYPLKLRDVFKRTLEVGMDIINDI
tara:strand:- start:6758 stop:7324 length:567 start_codon:yes stop_codon:yes gene_type:complete